MKLPCSRECHTGWLMTHSPLLPCLSLSSLHIIAFTLLSLSLVSPFLPPSSLAPPLLNTNLSVPFASFVSLWSPSSHSAITLFFCHFFPHSLPCLSRRNGDDMNLLHSRQSALFCKSLIQQFHNMTATNKPTETCSRNLIRNKRGGKLLGLLYWKSRPSTSPVGEHKYAE